MASRRNKIRNGVPAFADVGPPSRFFQLHVKPAPGLALVVGSKVFPGRADRRALYPDAVGLDMQPGEGVDIVHNLELPLGQTFAHIDCVSVLEHCPKPWMVAENIQHLMEPGSTLFLSVPFVWKFHGYPNDHFRFTAEGVKSLFPRIEWLRLMQGHHKLTEIERLPIIKHGEHPMLPRTEIYGFGVLK